MNQDNRVLGRTGARDLTMEEVNVVAGGHVRTLTPCIADTQGNLLNGDTAIGEC
ncbi:MAG TPA: hypothetical protein VFY05_09860 [Candidatus Angelobacter sp.]|nr:hypothetical protein [Candidatus Angelobacter sp.]